MIKFLCNLHKENWTSKWTIRTFWHWKFKTETIWELCKKLAFNFTSRLSKIAFCSWFSVQTCRILVQDVNYHLLLGIWHSLELSPALLNKQLLDIWFKSMIIVVECEQEKLHKQVNNLWILTLDLQHCFKYFDI